MSRGRWRMARGARRGLAARLLGRPRGPRQEHDAHARSLPATGGAHRHSGGLAAQSGIARNLRHSALLEAVELHRQAAADTSSTRRCAGTPPPSTSNPPPSRRSGSRPFASSRRRSDTGSSCAGWNIRATVEAGTMMPVSMWWLNAGVAPVYGEYSLAMRIGDAIVRVPVDIRKWLPGDAVFDGSLFVPESVKPGAHRLQVALLSPRTGSPRSAWPSRAASRTAGMTWERSKSRLHSEKSRWASHVRVMRSQPAADYGILVRPIHQDWGCRRSVHMARRSGAMDPGRYSGCRRFYRRERQRADCTYDQVDRPEER